VPSSQAFPGFLITAPPSVYVPDVIGVLAVWIQNQKKKIKVSCVYVFFFTCLSACVASAACFVFGFVFTTTFLFSVFFFCELNRYLCHGALDVRIALLLCLSPFSICMVIILIPAYVYLNVHTHFPPLPYSYTFMAIFICMFYDMFYVLHPSFCSLSSCPET